MNTKQSTQNSAGEHFEVDYFRPEDAEGIVALFRAVYGDGYPIKIFYDPQALIRANETGEYYSIVARNSDGVVVGAEHFYRSAPCKSLYELGAALVLKEYRNAGISNRMLKFGFQDWVPTRKNIEGVFGEAVCIHTHMLKAQTYFGYTETALEIAVMPAEAYEAEGAATGRVALQVAFRSHKPRPHRIFLPKVYEQELRFLYSAMDDEREFTGADHSFPLAGWSEIKMDFFEFAQVVRISVHQAGKDFEERLDELGAEALTKGAVVNQIWLNLGMPWVAAAVEVLRGRGYFFGGVFPRWFDQDGLFMQKLLCPPDFEAIKLASGRSHKLLEIIKQDWNDRFVQRRSIP